MKRFTFGLITLLFAAGLACGGEDTNNSCNSTHECTNGVCVCTTPGRMDMSCTEDQCEAQCRVCSNA